jgi:hypothetical protein
MKTVYLYKADGLFTGTYDAQENPEEPGVFITPSLSTDLVPTIMANTYPKFINGVWVNVPDHRGTVWNKATGSPIEYTQIGDLPAELTAVTKPADNMIFSFGSWVDDIPTLRVKQCNTLEASYNVIIGADISYLGHTFAADYATRGLISQILSTGQVMVGFYFQDTANVQVPMSYTELQGLAYAMFARGQVAFTQLQVLKALVRAATTRAAIIQIV